MPSSFDARVQEALDLFHVVTLQRGDFREAVDKMQMAAVACSLAHVSSVGIFLPVADVAFEFGIHERELYSCFYTVNVIQARQLGNKYSRLREYYAFV